MPGICATRVVACWEKPGARARRSAAAAMAATYFGVADMGEPPSFNGYILLPDGDKRPGTLRRDRRRAQNFPENFPTRPHYVSL